MYASQVTVYSASVVVVVGAVVVVVGAGTVTVLSTVLSTVTVRGGAESGYYPTHSAATPTMKPTARVSSNPATSNTALIVLPPYRLSGASPQPPRSTVERSSSSLSPFF
jgi:hypothetical protein